MKEETKAFASFRVLKGEASVGERDQLFRNMAQLFSYVSDRCDDGQVAEYDDVLCQLADLVEAKARAHVASVLAPLERAPGTVVVKLANDNIEVARPLLEFCNVLSDDDLIEVVNGRSEEHRVAIARRESVGERVGDAIVDMGGRQSVEELIRNQTAHLGEQTLEKLMKLAANDRELATNLRGRSDIDWKGLREKINAAGGQVLGRLNLSEPSSGGDTLGTVSAVVYNRIRNKAGFNAKEWKVSWNQVKALSDRRQLDVNALLRFARFGYGHHVAAALTMLLRVSPDVLVKWLAAQDYAAIAVASKAYGLNDEAFKGFIALLPWRDLPTEEDIAKVCADFKALSREEATGIFDLWRSHAFRQRSAPKDRKAGAA